jgi:hypothetical protein
VLLRPEEEGVDRVAAKVSEKGERGEERRERERGRRGGKDTSAELVSLFLRLSKNDTLSMPAGIGGDNGPNSCAPRRGSRRNAHVPNAHRCFELLPCLGVGV